jgi:imidazolonepropionase-like amidohydrolase
MKSISLSVCLLLLIIITGNLAKAQTTSPPATADMVIQAARMVDVKNGKIINNPMVFVSGNRITYVGSGTKIPQKSKMVQLGDVTLLPGLIDAHTHLLEIDNHDMGGLLTVAQASTAKRALMGVAHGREMLEAGFTSVRDLGNSGMNGDIALRDAINAGWVTGPRLFASGRALAPAGGQFGPMIPEAQGLISQEYAVVNNPDQARLAVRQAIYDGATWIKIIANQGRIRLSPAEIKVIMEEANNSHRPVAAHVTDDETARLVVEAGVTSIEHGYILSDETLKLMVKNNTYLVPTDGPTDSYVLGPHLTPEERTQLAAGVKGFRERSQDRLRRAVKAGVSIAAGSDSYVQVPGKSRGQAAQGMFSAYAEAGMTPSEIIKAATINAATLLGWHDRIGSLEPGRFADIVAVSGNPLENIESLSKVVFVMKDGKIVKPSV